MKSEQESVDDDDDEKMTKKGKAGGIADKQNEEGRNGQVEPITDMAEWLRGNYTSGYGRFQALKDIGNMGDKKPSLA